VAARLPIADSERCFQLLVISGHWTEKNPASRRQHIKAIELKYFAGPTARNGIRNFKCPLRVVCSRSKLYHVNVRFGSLAALQDPIISMTAFGGKAAIQSIGISLIRQSANGQKQTFGANCVVQLSFISLATSEHISMQSKQMKGVSPA